MLRYAAQLVRFAKAVVALKHKIHKLYKSFVLPKWRAPARWVWGIAAVSALLWGQFSESAPPLRVYFYDVGQGDAIHIRTSSGYDVLIDGGPSGRVVEKLGRTLPFWDHTVELMVLTHPHADHVVGLLEVLRRFEVKQVLATGVLHTTDEYLTWLEEIRSQNIPMTVAAKGQKWEVGEASLAILWPQEDVSGRRVVEGKIGEGGGLNDTSIVARLTFGETSFIFMGDATDKVEEALLGREVRSDVLKVGHHGSKYSTSRVFLEAVQPKYAAIQVGKNRYSHPAYGALWRLKQAGVEVLRNDTDGDVVFESDGKSLQLTAKQ